MSFIEILESIFIGPLYLLFEIIFVTAKRFAGHDGQAIIVLSLVMNFLVLPLYRRADAMQEEAKNVDEKLRDGVAHIKKAFKGDERMMILQTYYRQNNYKPTDALNGSVSLLLQVPFFMAAYNFLSGLQTLKGLSFGPIADLGAPDGLIVIGSVTLNLLPVLMTLVNIISSALYSKGYPLKTKIQLYAMALFFLVFLYESPSGLVFYWTMNNVFSLGKTIVSKIRIPKKVLTWFCRIGLTAASALGLFFIYRGLTNKIMMHLIIGLALNLPLIVAVGLKFISKALTTTSAKPNKNAFLFGTLFIALLIGLMIPSTYIAASPQEFVDPTLFHHPTWYIVESVCVAFGLFVVWFGVFYWLATEKGKVMFDNIIWLMCGIMLVNYLFFGTDLGVIFSNLKYENALHFSITEILINIAAITVLIAAMYFIIQKWRKKIAVILMIASLAVGAFGCVNLFTIHQSVSNISVNSSINTGTVPEFELSADGQNVVVIMLDRAIGEYFPYILNEKEALKDQFAGFTYYSNTLSYGCCTNFALPPVMGGYEYTPVEMNKRNDKLLSEKHNEALLMMPVMFMQNGFDVTVCDPTYANYNWIPDLSVFDPYPEIDSYLSTGVFMTTEQKTEVINNNHRNFFCFALMKTMPLGLQPLLYNSGNYLNSANPVYAGQTQYSTTQSEGLFHEFMDEYNVLNNLSNITKINNTETGSFIFMTNDTPHAPQLLQAPDYAPAVTVDNTLYEEQNAINRTYNGNTLSLTKPTVMASYHANMAAYIQLGNWFDYLREIGVYDNTRIIIVSDHSYAQYHHPDMVANNSTAIEMDLEFYCPLLLVKDFNSNTLTFCDSFMTNADVPTLAVNGLLDNPVNPFTGCPIQNDDKFSHDQFVILSTNFDISSNNGYTFLPDSWASVNHDVWNIENWTIHMDETVLSEHSFTETE